MKKIFWLLFAIILSAATVARLYGLTNPVADWHSWRQADTAAVARNFLKFGLDPLRPRFDDLSNIPSGKDNPAGWRMVEFPLYQVIGATLTRMAPQYSLEAWLRLTTILASVLTILFLGLLVTMFIDKTTGLVTAFVLATLPYAIYYGRTVLPEPFAVFWSVLSVYILSLAFAQQGKRRTVFLLVSAVAGAIALLVKPFAVFLLLPAFYLFFRNFSFTKSWLFGLVAYWVVILYPLWWWRSWITQFPEGIPAYTWLFNAGNIRFKGAWFWWLFAERLGKIILGYWGLFFLGTGLIAQPAKKEGWFFRWWLAGALLYLVIVARGNVQHDYYQVLIVPAVAIYVAKGLVYLLKTQAAPRISSILLVLTSVVFTLAFSWYTVRTYYWINRPAIIEAGKTADLLLPKDAKVIAPYNGDTTFLYQINRQGWPIGFDIERKITAGATHYVTVSPTDSDLETKDLSRRFTVLVRTDTFAIIDLTKKANNP